MALSVGSGCSADCRSQRSFDLADGERPVIYPPPPPRPANNKVPKQYGRSEQQVFVGQAVQCRPLLSRGAGGQGGFPVRSLVDGAGSYSVAHRAGLLPTGLTGMWCWILLRSPHQGRGPPPAPAPTKQRPGSVCAAKCK